MNKIIKYPVNDLMRFSAIKIEQLDVLLNKLIKPRKFWQQSISIDDILVITESTVNARFALWAEVYKLYPELIGKSLRYTEKEIIIL